MTASIDVHSHFFPLEILDVLRREGARYPFDMGSPAPRDVVEAQAALTADERERVYRDTALEFLGLGDRHHDDAGRTP